MPLCSYKKGYYPAPYVDVAVYHICVLGSSSNGLIPQAGLKEALLEVCVRGGGGAVTLPVPAENLGDRRVRVTQSLHLLGSGSTSKVIPCPYAMPTVKGFRVQLVWVFLKMLVPFW